METQIAEQLERPTEDHDGADAGLAEGASDQLDKDAPPHVVARVNMIGRCVLFSFSAAAVFFCITTVLMLLWLIPGIRSQDWFIGLLAVFVSATAISGLAFLIIMFPVQRFGIPTRTFMNKPLRDAKVHIALTSYNDEVAVVGAVKDFKAQPEIDQVIVVDNNSSDNSIANAEAAGADRVVSESIQGYGACCQRCLSEAAEGLDDDDVIILCEGDMTFSAADVRKLLAYLEHCDMVLGTRTTQELRATETQLDLLMNMGNQIVAKLLQLRFWETRLTDCGCTFRALRVGTYRELRGELTHTGMMFGVQMIIQSLKRRMRILEIPIVFRERVGESKGVGSNKIKAFMATLDILKMLYRS